MTTTEGEIGAIAIHCLQGVRDQVQDDLSDLNSINPDKGKIMREIMLDADSLERPGPLQLLVYDLFDGYTLMLRRPDTREVEQVSDNFLRQSDLRTENVQVFPDLAGCFLQHGLEVVDGIRHHTKRIPQLVTDSTGKQAEHRQLFFSNQRLLGFSKLSERRFQLARPGCYAPFQLAVRVLDLVRHVVERLAKDTQLVLAGYDHPASIVTGRNVLRRESHVLKRRRNLPADQPRRDRANDQNQKPSQRHPREKSPRGRKYRARPKIHPHHPGRLPHYGPGTQPTAAVGRLVGQD